MHQLLLVLVGAIGIGLGIGAALSVPKGGETPQEASVTSAFEESKEGEVEDKENNTVARELYDVIKVIDGDTVTIKMRGEDETVRLIGIDTPETNDARSGVQCFGAEATAHLKKIIGKRVAVEKDAGEGERDKYDRLLAYLFSENGANLNKQMIEDGFAYEYTYDDAYKYQKEFKAAEKITKQEGRGLWAPDACPPDQQAGPEPAPKAVIKKEVPPATAVAAPAAVLGTSTATTTAPASTAPESKIKEVEPEVKKEEPKPEPEPEKEESSAQSTSQYTCATNKYNCTNFKTRAEAQAVYDHCGGASNDIHKLDSNKDGEACESLP